MFAPVEDLKAKEGEIFSVLAIDESLVVARVPEEVDLEEKGTVFVVERGGV